MKKKLYFLLTVLAMILAAPTAQARWVIGDDPISWSDIQDGQKVFIQCTYTDQGNHFAALDGKYFTSADTYREQAMDASDPRMAWTMEMEGTDGVTGLTIWVLKNEGNGKYMGAPVNSNMTFVDSKEDACRLLMAAASPYKQDCNGTELPVGAKMNTASQPSWWDETLSSTDEDYQQTFPEHMFTLVQMEKGEVKHFCYYPQNGAGYTIWEYADTGVFTVWPATYEDNPYDDLSDMASNFEATGFTDLTPGDAPFQINEEYYNSVIAVYNQAITAKTSTPKEELVRLYNELRDIIADYKNHFNALTDGYYFIRGSVPDRTHTMYINSEGQLMWKNFDENTKGMFVMHIQHIDGVRYKISNADDSWYLNTLGEDNNEKPVWSTHEFTTAQIMKISENDPLYATIRPESGMSDGFFYHMAQKARAQGRIVRWYDDQDATHYSFEAAPSDSISIWLEQARQKTLDDGLASKITQAEQLYNAQYRYSAVRKNPLITDVSQITVNRAEATEGSIDALIDGLMTAESGFYHTQWNQAKLEDGNDQYRNEDTYPYIQYETPEALPTSLRFFYGTRMDKANVADASMQRINKLLIEVSEDGETFDSLTTLSNPEANFPVAPNSNVGDTYLSEPITVPAGKMFIRFNVLETKNWNGTINGSMNQGYPLFALSELQLYRAEDAGTILDPTISQGARSEVNEACQALQTAINTAREVEAGSTVQENIDAIQAAIDAVNAVLADTSSLADNIKAARDAAGNAAPDAGEEVMGQVPQSAIDALTAVADEVAGKAPYYSFTRAEVDAMNAQLIQAMDDFNAAMILPKTGVAYYLAGVASGDEPSDENDNKGTGTYERGSNDKVICAMGYGPKAEIRWLTASADDPDQGKYQHQQNNARAAWELIKLDGPGFAIRNVATGWYMGQTFQSRATYMSDTIVPYEFIAAGFGQICFRPINTRNQANTRIHAAAGGTVCGWDSGANTASAWNFIECPDELTDQKTYEPGRNYIVTLPYNTFNLPEDISDASADVTVYTLAGGEKDADGNITKLHFDAVAEDAVLEAGKPYLVAIGEADAESVLLDMYMDNEDRGLTNVATAVNGLVGTFRTDTLLNSYGYFDAEGLKASVKGETVVAAQEGYISPNDVPVVSGTHDLVIELTGEGVLNGVKKVVAGAKALVNIYTIDGVLVKKNVKADAVNALPKGVYVVGKKKVIRK